MKVIKPLHGGNPHLNEGTKRVNVRYLDLRKAVMRTKICTRHILPEMMVYGIMVMNPTACQSVNRSPKNQIQRWETFAHRAISDHEMNFYTPEIQQLRPLKTMVGLENDPASFLSGATWC